MGTLVKKSSPKPVDPLDVAYLAIGANQAWTEAHEALLNSIDGGQMGFIEQVINAGGPALADLWDAQGEDLEGLWYYDVSEPVGLAIGKAILEGTSYNAAVIARACMGTVVDCGHSGCRQNWIETGSRECAE